MRRDAMPNTCYILRKRVKHTNTSSMNGGSTTSLFYRDLGARWLARGGRRAKALGKNPSSGEEPLFSWCPDLLFEERFGNVARLPGRPTDLGCISLIG